MSKRKVLICIRAKKHVRIFYECGSQYCIFYKISLENNSISCYTFLIISLSLSLFLMKTLSFSRKGMWYLLIGMLIAGLFSGFIPQADVLAQGDNGLGAALLFDEDRPTDAVVSPFRDAVVGFINYFLGFLGLVAVAFVVYAGVLMVTSQGEDENTGKAKKILLYAGAGIVIVLLSFAIVRLIVGAGDAVA